MSPRVNPQQTKTSLLTSVGVRSEVLSKPARFITSTACPTVENSAKQAKLNQGIPSLTWDSTLESYATDWAATRTAAGDDCALIHSGGPYGENIFWSTGPSPPADAVQSWVSEEAYYDYASNSCSAPEGESCGHYTQVVWRDTAALGCGSATCPSGALFVVCSYDPAETLTVSCLTRPPLRIAAAVERLRVSSLLKWWTYSNQSTYITCTSVDEYRSQIREGAGMRISWEGTPSLPGVRMTESAVGIVFLNRGYCECFYPGRVLTYIL